MQRLQANVRALCPMWSMLQKIDVRKVATFAKSNTCASEGRLPNVVHAPLEGPKP